MDMTPLELQQKYPIGYTFRLNQMTSQMAAFVMKVRDNLNYFHRQLHDKVDQDVMFRERLQDDERRGKALNELIDELIDRDPFATWWSINANGGLSCPVAGQLAMQNTNVMNQLLWALIYADIHQQAQLPRRYIEAMRLTILTPPGRGVLIRGYEFTAADLGVDPDDDGDSEVPDYVPPEFLDGVFGIDDDEYDEDEETD